VALADIRPEFVIFALPRQQTRSGLYAPDVSALFKPIQFVMDRNIRCHVQDHQNNQWMKIIVVAQFGFLLRSTENISLPYWPAHAQPSLLHFIITMTSSAPGTLLKTA
jgi:hypothetical protein